VLLFLLLPTSFCRRSAKYVRLSLRSSCVRQQIFSVIVVLYRPGSAEVQREFYDELSVVLDRTQCAEFWCSTLEANQSNPHSHKLCKLVDDLLGRGSVPASLAIHVEVFSRFFTDKVAKMRSRTADAPAPTFTRAPPGVFFQKFQPLVTDVISAVRRLPDESSSSQSVISSAADLIPTSVLTVEAAVSSCTCMCAMYNDCVALCKEYLKQYVLNET